MPFMSESTQIYGSNAAALSAFPEPVRATLHLIEKNRSIEVAQTLTHFVASFVHPDFVCNLADFQHLDEGVKRAAKEFFEFCLTQGLTVEEQGAILAWITPYMQSHLGLAKPN